MPPECSAPVVKRHRRKSIHVDIKRPDRRGDKPKRRLHLGPGHVPCRRVAQQHRDNGVQITTRLGKHRRQIVNQPRRRIVRHEMHRQFTSDMARRIRMHRQIVQRRQYIIKARHIAAIGFAQNHLGARFGYIAQKGKAVLGAIGQPRQ